MTTAQVFLLAFLLIGGTEKIFSQNIIAGLRESDEVILSEKADVAVSVDKPKEVSTGYDQKKKIAELLSETIQKKDIRQQLAEWSDKEAARFGERPTEEEIDYDKEKEKSQVEGRDKFHWKPALIQSGIFLGIQHGARMTQMKTRRQLGGPFFRDWGKSVKSLRGWGDGDNVLINYIGHPLQGGATGRIFINNSDNAARQEFGKSRQYWISRLKALAWSTVWSTQFEIGPISEATIGNVGIVDKKNYSEMAYVDMVMTPIAGTAVVVGEDAIDKYILKNWLEPKAGKLTNRIKLLRSILTPTTSFTNLLRGKPPWKRNDRK